MHPEMHCNRILKEIGPQATTHRRVHMFEMEWRSRMCDNFKTLNTKDTLPILRRNKSGAHNRKAGYKYMGIVLVKLQIEVFSAGVLCTCTIIISHPKKLPSAIYRRGNRGFPRTEIHQGH